jgi:hypothetical protein
MLRSVLACSLLAAMSAPVFAERTVAVAPLSTLGAEEKSATTKQILSDIEAAIGSFGNKVIPAATVAAAIEKARKPQLTACEGDTACLTELGKLVGAQVVVSGEVGGLGDSKVIYFSATDVATGKELRSTTLTLSANEGSGGVNGAAIRLLDPDKYRGSLHFVIDVGGATVFVNGSKVTPGAHGELALAVGTQAVRVTHPQYHDFIKFIDVTYGKTTEVPINMQEYPIVEHDFKARPTSQDTVVMVDKPIWRRWYVLYPAIAVIGVGVGVLAYWAAHKFPAYDNCRMTNGDPCK